MNDVVKFEVSWQTLWKIFAFFIIVAILYFGRQALGVFLISVVVSLGLDRLVDALERRKIPRLLGTLFVFLVGLVLLALILYVVAPVVIQETRGFIGHFNRALATFFGTGLPESVIQNVTLSLENALGFLSAANISVTGAIGVVFEKLILILVTIIITFYLTVDKEGTERLLRVVLPNVYEKRVLSIFSRFKEKIHSWLIAQFGLSIMVGGMVALGLWLLGVRYALVLGLLAAVFEIVPVIGPIVSGLLAFFVAVSDSLSLGLYAIFFFFIVQQIENHILIPLVMGRAMKLHPVIVVLALLVGAEVAGLVGIVLAVPIAVLLQEIFNYLVEEKERRATFTI